MTVNDAAKLTETEKQASNSKLNFCLLQFPYTSAC